MIFFHFSTDFQVSIVFPSSPTTHKRATEHPRQPEIEERVVTRVHVRRHVAVIRPFNPDDTCCVYKDPDTEFQRREENIDDK